MVRRIGSFRSGTRHKLRKVPRTSGKVTITRILKKFKVGDKVTINHEPAIHNGMPHPRFKNSMGVITEVRGRAYVIRIKDKNSTKHLIAGAVHLKQV